jgi:hypothetical protein
MDIRDVTDSIKIKENMTIINPTENIGGVTYQI